jgi:hypothetical protein
MRRRLMIGGAILLMQALGAAFAVAGPWEDGMAAYNRGDYIPAMQLFRAMAQQGNAKAQNLLGVMYRKGEGVKRDPTRAQMWFGVAARGGDPVAREEWARLSRELGPKQTERAREMAQACEASNYRNCEY